jgi:hypothetical protein
MKSNIALFWETLKVVIFQKTGKDHLAYPLAGYNRFVKEVNKIVGSSKKVLILGLKKTDNELLLALESSGLQLKQVHLISLIKISSKRCSVTTETFKHSKKAWLKKMCQSKNLFSKEDFYKKEFDSLLSLIGEAPLKELLKEEASLQIWRNSTPHNWWIESSSKETLWHNDTQKMFSSKPKLSLFENTNNSSRTVSYGGSLFRGSDEFKPQHSFYSLKPEVKKFFQKFV